MRIPQILKDARKSGLRITPARKAIITFFSESSQPLSAADVLVRVPVNKTTIYREVETLISHGYLTEVDLGDGIKRYELASRPHHHHLICVECKSVTDVDVSEDFKKQEERIASEEKFNILKHRLEFFGVCKSCYT